MMTNRFDDFNPADAKLVSNRQPRRRNLRTTMMPAQRDTPPPSDSGLKYAGRAILETVVIADACLRLFAR